MDNFTRTIIDDLGLKSIALVHERLLYLNTTPNGLHITTSHDLQVVRIYTGDQLLADAHTRIKQKDMKTLS